MVATDNKERTASPAAPALDAIDLEEQKKAAEARAITIANPDVVTKYKTAADITLAAMKKVVSACTATTSIHALCAVGDAALLEGCGKVYNKDKKMSKGVAFPTCVSVNHVIMHFSPLAGTEVEDLKEGDMVKIELGAQIDGFPAIMAHTLIVGATAANPATGPRAAALLAAHTASEAALRLLRAGKSTTEVSDAISAVAKAYGVDAVAGMMSHAITQHKMDAEPTIMLAPTIEQRKGHKAAILEENTVMALDVILAVDPEATPDAAATTDGGCKSKAMDTRTTVYRRTDATKFALKMKTSRAVLAEATTKFGTMAFNLRDMEDEKKARMGVIECAKHNLLYAHDVLCAKEGVFVSQFLFTVLLTPTGPLRLTPTLFDAATCSLAQDLGVSALTEEMQSLLKEACRVTKKKTKKKTKKAATAAATASEETKA